jgi:hypothetical protein
MAVRIVRSSGNGSAVIAATNNAPTGTNAATIVSNNGALNVPTMANYTTLADAVNAILAALQAHGVINTA